MHTKLDCVPRKGVKRKAFWNEFYVPELFSCEAKFAQWSKKFPALDEWE